MQKIFAIIPARGGSKRLPRKNLMPFAGKPLSVHSIEQANKSSLVSRVIVSTEDNDIADVSLKYGAEIIMRPDELSRDTSSSEDALLHVLDNIEESSQEVPDLVVFLQCTSPLRNNDDIDRAIMSLIGNDADSLFSACRFDKYIWHELDGELQSINYNYNNRWREQDFPVQYQENGSIYVFKSWILRKFNNRLGGKIVIYEMDCLNSFQIDTLQDFRLCEFIYKQTS